MADGYEIRGRYWPPAARGVRRALLYLHGIQSHGGWYEWSAARLAAGGAAVLMPDRRGSGLNAAARGDVAARAVWLADVEAHAAWLREAAGAERIGVVGVSWGGKPAAALALRRPEWVAALLLVCPGIFPRVDVSVVRKIQIGMALLARPERQFPIPLNDPRLFTENPDGQRFIADDPLKLTTVTARFLIESVRLDRELRRAGAGALAAATTLLLAERDAIIHNEPTERWLRRVGARPPQVETLRDAAHTLEFERDPGPFGAALDRWRDGAR
jgi:alpha-beta hydrolase superfamily lysophospholipase